MAAMEPCRTAPDPFTLNYRKLTTVNLFRLGNVEKPIGHGLRDRCLSYTEWREREREGNSAGNRETLRRVDFVLDDSDHQILTEESSGNNELLRNLSQSFSCSILGLLLFSRN